MTLAAAETAVTPVRSPSINVVVVSALVVFDCPRFRVPGRAFAGSGREPWMRQAGGGMQIANQTDYLQPRPCRSGQEMNEGSTFEAVRTMAHIPLGTRHAFLARATGICARCCLFPRKFPHRSAIPIHRSGLSSGSASLSGRVKETLWMERPNLGPAGGVEGVGDLPWRAERTHSQFNGIETVGKRTWHELRSSLVERVSVRPP